MQPIPLDQQATFKIRVSNQMTVQFEELGAVHPVYATYWMTKHMELVSRKLLLPFLEPGEEAIGHEVTVCHIASALPGMQVRITAHHLKTDRSRIYMRCQAYNELGDLIGEGQTTQVLLPWKNLRPTSKGYKHAGSNTSRHPLALSPENRAQMLARLSPFSQKDSCSTVT
ncbi:hypothetical protein KDK_43180 [Dictyobacter kobayashii]|uniref:Fluoroacetyl-CoA-specific thioesterase-like domain-containing protein n=1 Tax=Dictyobacter kobayashii TaxID=2014872 RepID=A0A402AMV1_9CHLR|nr:thioesterase family protein [Dictyobacter kobayashii]GCE20518.1 hypothetical protein KDK_43180 [Dictyobacter kobayashii]